MGLVATIYGVNCPEEDVIELHLSTDSEEYFSKDGTDVIRSIYGTRFPARKLVKSVKKKLIGAEFKMDKGEIPNFDDKLRKVLIAG